MSRQAVSQGHKTGKIGIAVDHESNNSHGHVAVCQRRSARTCCRTEKSIQLAALLYSLGDFLLKMPVRALLIKYKNSRGYAKQHATAYVLPPSFMTQRTSRCSNQYRICAVSLNNHDMSKSQLHTGILFQQHSLGL